jgi:hypothetical protein
MRLVQVACLVFALPLSGCATRHQTVDVPPAERSGSSLPPWVDYGDPLDNYPPLKVAAAIGVVILIVGITLLVLYCEAHSDG